MKPITHISCLAPLALSVALTAAMTTPLTAAPDSLPGAGLASVTYGPYLRAEFGMATTDINDGSWQPHGYPSDPQVNFDLSGEDGSFDTVAMGFDWMNGYRFDLGMTFSESMSVTGPCASASDGSSCAIHADITSASLKTNALMGSLYYSPLEAAGKNTTFNPFVVVGLGLANNKVGDWTRTNDSLSTGVDRSFEGDSSTSLAYSLGFGASWQVTKPGQWPVILEASYRYYNFGTAQGGSTPINGGQSPVTPLTFDVDNQVVSIGVRVPLQRM